ncbi:Uncharacterised protein [uncultured archaeon]|nr:Uncharacterised protein [uncultured archaeon]
MRKLLFVAVCILLLIPIVYAKVTPINGAPILTMKKANDIRYQTVRISTTSFTRTVDGVRHAIRAEKFDKTANKIVFSDRYSGKIQNLFMNYDSKGLGKLTIGTKTYQMIFEPKYSSAKIEY